MGLCTICVRRVGARLGMVAWSVERESQRRVSSYRVVAQRASCQGQTRSLFPLPPTAPSPRRKSDYQRRHKHNAFPNSAKWLFLVSLFLFSYFSSLCQALLWLESKAPSYRNYPHSTPPPLLPFVVFYIFQFFLCAVPLESAGCNYVHVN
jgi:hypothetical protein